MSHFHKHQNVMGPERTVLLLSVKIAQIGFGSINKHCVQKILLSRTVYRSEEAKVCKPVNDDFSRSFKML